MTVDALILVKSGVSGAACVAQWLTACSCAVHYNLTNIMQPDDSFSAQLLIRLFVPGDSVSLSDWVCLSGGAPCF